jgi:hypothetical protein
MRLLSLIAFWSISTSSYAALPFTEDFSTTTFRDGNPGQTTADWNTGFAQLLLPVAPQLDGITFDETSVVEVIFGSNSTRALALADLNGDGYIDLIDGTNRRDGVQLNNGSGVFETRSYSSPRFTNTRAIAVGDVDRDGDIDFVTAVYDPGLQILLYLNDGTGTFFDIQDVSVNAAITSDVALADIDGDGFLDVIAANDNGYDNKLFINTRDPLMPFGVEGSEGLDLGPGLREDSRRVAVGDLDKDGDLDIVFMNEERNRVFMNRLAQGDPLTFSQSEIEIPGSNDVGFSFDGALGDLNGDGYLDLVVCNYFADGGAEQASNVYFNDGVGAPNNNPFTIVAVDFTAGEPVSCGSVATADADNDGDLDIFLTSKTVNFRNRVYFNSDGSGATFAAVDVGPIGQAPLVLLDPPFVGAVSDEGAVGDIDNDGDIDWVIGNQGNSGPLNNTLFRNSGVGSGSPVQQLRAKATSLQIDNSGVSSVKLNPAPDTSMVGPEFLNQLDYWVSGNAGQTWASIMPDGRPVAIAAGTDVRWRAELRSESPALAAGLALIQLDITANDSGPVLVTPIVSAEVIERDPITGLPIVSDFADADGDTLYYSLTGLPAGSGLRIDPLTGEISGVPTNDDSVASPITATVLATDGALTATDTFTLNVINANDPPVFTSTPPIMNATQDVLYTYAVTADDPDPNETQLLTFSVSEAPAWLSLTDNLDGTATLSGTPANSDVTGPSSVILVVTDPDGLFDTQSFDVIVDNVNDPPVFVSSPPVAAVAQGTPYIYDILTNDPDDGETAQATITATISPAWLTFVDNGDGTATLSGVPSNSDVTGDNTVNLVVSDPAGLSDTQNFVIDVINVNDPPVFDSTPLTDAVQNVPYLYAISATDIDFDETQSLTITATIKPDWLTLVDNGGGTATLSGTPLAADVDIDNSVTLVVSDQNGGTDTQAFVVIVEDRPDTPVFTSTPLESATINVLYTYNVSAVDPDLGETEALVFSAPTLPAWLSFSDTGNGTAILTGTPRISDTGRDNSVVIDVIDPSGLGNTQSFVIDIPDTNFAPEFESLPLTSATESVEYRYSIRAIDPNGDSITISASTLPDWLTLTDSGGGFAVLRGTPESRDIGDNSVIIEATEDSRTPSLTATQQFIVTVAGSEFGPTISLNGNAEINIFVGDVFEDPGATATDLEEGNLTNRIQTTGSVNTSAAGYYTLTYTVSDGAGNSAQAQRTVRVVDLPKEGGIGSAGLAWLFGLLLIAGRRRLSRRPERSN